MSGRPSADPHRIRAWDLPTRLFHWSLVLLVAGQWASYEYAEALGDVTLDIHRAGGLAILVLLVWRVLWGVAGPSTARFSMFLGSPASALRYARDLVSGRARNFLGHNPLGAWMVIALLAALTAQAAFGLFAVDDNDLTGGPLHRLVSEAANERATVWHRRIFEYVILPLVAVHILANALYGAVKKEPLITAMITGTKPAAAYEDAPAGGEQVAKPAIRIGLRAIACLVAAILIVLGGLWLAGGKF